MDACERKVLGMELLSAWVSCPDFRIAHNVLRQTHNASARRSVKTMGVKIEIHGLENMRCAENSYIKAQCDVEKRAVLPCC